MKQDKCKVNSIDEICSGKCPSWSTSVAINRPEGITKTAATGQRLLENVIGIAETGIKQFSEMLQLPPVKLLPKRDRNEFPSCILAEKYPYLHHLGLYGAGVSAVPDLSGAKVPLESIDLERNNIETLKATNLGTGMREINLSYNPIKKIDGLPYLKRLETLVLRDNGTIPVEVIYGAETLPALDSIDLRRTTIAGFPGIPSKKLDKADVVKMKSVLRATRGKQGKKIASASSIFGKDICTPHFHPDAGLLLNDLGLKSIPGCVENVKDATVVDLSRNNLKNVTQLQAMKRDDLESLDLSGNNLDGKDATEGIENFKNLKILSLKENGIENMDDIRVPPSIEKLNLDGNVVRAITNMPLDYRYKNLRELSLRNNRLGTDGEGKEMDATGVLNGLGAMERLKSLDLSGNPGLRSIVCDKKNRYYWHRKLEGKEVTKLVKWISGGKCRQS